MSTFDRAQRFMAKVRLSHCKEPGSPFAVACVLIGGFGLTDDQALSLLQEYLSGAGMVYTPSSLRRQVHKARRKFIGRSRGYLVTDL